MKTLNQFVDECIRIELNKEKPDRENITNLLLRKRLLNDKIMAYNIKKRERTFQYLSAGELVCTVDFQGYVISYE